MRYRYNRACNCARCRAHGLTGPAVLITIGVLFLLDQMGHQHWMQFDYTWPALLIVIGLIKLMEHSASIEGHIPREYNMMPPNPNPPIPPGAQYQGYPPPQGPVAPPPPVSPAGFIQPPGRSDDKGVHNG